MARLVLSVVGSDRPGLTQALASAVVAAGGNWLESHLSRLGGLYVGSVLGDVDAEGSDQLISAVRAVDADGLDVRIAPAIETGEIAGGAVQFSLVGQDRRGIVHQVTAVLRDLNVNIEAFDTQIVAEPYSGAQLFRVEARLRLPRSLATDSVRVALEQISAEIMVDISLTAAEES